MVLNLKQCKGEGLNLKHYEHIGLSGATGLLKLSGSIEQHLCGSLSQSHA